MQRSNPGLGTGGYLTVRPGHRGYPPFLRVRWRRDGLPGAGECGALRADRSVGTTGPNTSDPIWKAQSGLSARATGNRIARRSRHGPEASRATTTSREASVIPPTADTTSHVILAGLLHEHGDGALLAASQLIDYGLFNLRITALDADTHASVFGIVSLLAAVAVAATVVWRGRREQRRRSEWFVLAALLAVLVVVRTTGFFNLTIEAPLLAVMFGLLWWLTWRDPRGPGLSCGQPSSSWPCPWCCTRWVWTLTRSITVTTVGPTSSPRSRSRTELAGWILIATGIIAGKQNRPVPESSAPESFVLEMESVAR